MIDEYPLVRVDIKLLEYKRFAPEMLVRHPGVVPELYRNWFPLMEKKLPELKEPLERFGGYGISAIRNLYEVYQSLLTTKKMQNPLLVRPNRAIMPNMYYVIRGGQRLCALRALGYVGKVPCRVTKLTDSWNDATQAFVAHPYS
jgi:hypothetical protein